MTADGAVVPRPAPRWWVLGTVLLGGALLCVFAWVAVTHSGANRFGNVRPVKVAGSALQLVRGAGHPELSSFVVESSAEGIAALSAEVPPFAAANYRRVEWTLRTSQPPDGLAFVWRTRENPRRTYSKPLQWLADRIAPMNLDESDGWKGTITGIGLVARGQLPAAIEVEAVRFPAASARAVLAETFGQWVAPVSLKGYAIAFPFDAERADTLPMAQAIASAVALAMAAYFLLARLRGWPADARVFWAIFAAGWILLDARWQFDLGRESARAAARFAGKLPENKNLAADDGPIYMLAQDIRKALPPPPARVIVLCDNKVLGVRIAHFLYPHNVSRNVKTKEGEAAGTTLRSSFSAASSSTPQRSGWPGRTAVRCPPN